MTTKTITLIQSATAVVSVTKTFTSALSHRLLAREVVDGDKIIAGPVSVHHELDERSPVDTANESGSQASSPSPRLEQVAISGRARNGPVCSKCAAGVVYGTGSGAVQYCCPIRTFSTSTSFATVTKKTTVTRTKTLSITIKKNVPVIFNARFVEKNRTTHFNDIAVDNDANVYVVGYTDANTLSRLSTAYPGWTRATSNPDPSIQSSIQTIIVAKFSANGTILWWVSGLRKFS